MSDIVSFPSAPARLAGTVVAAVVTGAAVGGGAVVGTTPTVVDDAVSLPPHALTNVTSERPATPARRNRLADDRTLTHLI
jgi:hypothetical protein